MNKLKTDFVNMFAFLYKYFHIIIGIFWTILGIENAFRGGWAVASLEVLIGVLYIQIFFERKSTEFFRNLTDKSIKLLHSMNKDFAALLKFEEDRNEEALKETLEENNSELDEFFKDELKHE